MKNILQLVQNNALIVIFLLALLLRVGGLNSFPVGFHSDEARVGWNAVSIAQTGKDDWGNRLPLYYNTFGDYRPTGIIYATIPSILLFGRSEFAIRFPSALFGALAVFPIAFITTKISKQKKNFLVGIAASFIWAVTPWTIGTSRATSEVVMSATLVLFGLAFFLKSLESKFNKRQLLIGFLFVSASTFFYHTARILVPIYWIVFAFYYRSEIAKVQLTKLVAISIFLLCILTGFFSLGQASRGRLAQVSILQTNVLGANTTSKQSHTFFSLSRAFVVQYSTYLSPEFLVGNTARPLRYTTDQSGLISIATLILFLIGVGLIIKSKLTSLPLALLLISPLPAAITIEDVPNLHRAFFMLPFLIIIAGYGLVSLKNKSVFFVPIIALLLISFLGFLTNYFGTNSVTLATYRNGNAKEMALYLNEVQPSYEKIYVTNDPDSPYPWYAFFTGKLAAEFNASAETRTQGAWSYQNIMFTISRCPSAAALDKKNNDLGKILIIDGYKCEKGPVESDHPEAHIVKEFFYPNGEVVYRVWERDAVTNRK